MALTFHYCRSCGGKTQINLSVAPAERLCMLCGESCSGEDVIDTTEGERLAPEDQSDTAADDGPRHEPREMAAIHCPRCRVLTTVAVDEALSKQRCHNCGMLLEEERTRKSRMRKPGKYTSDGLLAKRVRERVWLPMTGVALCFVLVATFAMWMMWHPKASSAPPAEPPAPDPREQIRSLAGQWMIAKSPDDLLPLIREPDKFGSELRDWCSSRPQVLPLGGAILSIRYPRRVLGANVAEVTVRFDTIPGMNMIVVETLAGWKVEWRAFSGIADLSVEDFLRKKPTVPTLVMAVVLRSDYFNGAYSDGKTWLCLRLNDRTGSHPFYAYVPRAKTELLAAMEVLPPVGTGPRFDATKASRLMALRLHFGDPASAESGQAEVTSIAGESWYVP